MQTLLNGSRSVDTLLQAFWSPLEVIAGKAHLSYAVSGVTITVPYWHIEPSHSLSHTTINAVGSQLATLVERPVRLELVRVFTPLLDAHMLAHFFSRELTDSTFRKVIIALFANIGPLSNSGPLGMEYSQPLQPGTLVGIKVRLAGRLLKEASRPRQTIQSASLGSLTASVKHVVQAASYTVSNQKGSYTVKVWLCIKL